MSSYQEKVQRDVAQQQRNGGTGFDKKSYDTGTSQHRQAVDTATNKNK